MAVFMLLFSPAQPCRENVNSSNFSFHINVKITVVSTRLQRDLNIHPLAPKKWFAVRATGWNHQPHLPILVPSVAVWH